MASLAEKKLSVSRPRMGRPAIGKFTAVRLSPEMLARIDALTGPGKRAEFIREAVERELQRREKP
jgi:predicted DNA-binding protein